MPTVLGLHIGHHASCAVVRDGALAAAIQQERSTRIKADGQEALSNRLPAHECLRAARVSLDEIDLFVSSFQSASPGGVGLHRPLVEEGFELFDPWDDRHLVISHHRAHALSALCTSGFHEAAVLVCDLGGSTTTDGQDFFVSFPEFIAQLCSLHAAHECKTECLSIYHARGRRLTLKVREFCVPHNTPDVFVQNAASLYDNVARAIFRRENAHGQLMALAGMLEGKSVSGVKAEDIVAVSDGAVQFRNDWQFGLSRRVPVLDLAPLANAVQRALELVFVEYARKACSVTASANLAASGGVFLNILANSAIAESGMFESVYVPSAPHDAGIAVGCAFGGWQELARRSRAAIRVCERPSDRLGPRYDLATWDDELLAAGAQAFVAREAATPSAVARLLRDGHIVARRAGRSEFGPRALGGRSLLGTPLLESTKSRLNAIKGRQPWRPVAPVILRERIGEFLEGPADAPYMNFVHRVPSRHRGSLPALYHPDGTTRAQTLVEAEDPFLYALLVEFDRLTGFPILVNTSLNGPNEPNIETLEQALDFFNAHSDVDDLLIEERLVMRVGVRSWRNARLADDTIINIVYPAGKKRIIMIRRGVSMEITQDAFDAVELQRSRATNGATEEIEVEETVEAELNEALKRGLFTVA